MELVAWLGQVIVLLIFVVWPLAILGKIVTEHQILDEQKWKQREESQQMKERYGGRYKVK